MIQVKDSSEGCEVIFAADPAGGCKALWFCFRLVETAPAETHPDKITLTLVFTRNMLGFEQPANCHPAYQPQGKNWFRTGGGMVRTREDGQVRVSWQIPYPSPSTEVALCHPYGRNEVDILVRKSKNFWRTDVIGLSQDGRKMLRLSNDYGKTAGQQSGLYFVGRQYGGETPGSWVMDGVLERLSREKKNDAVVWGVPFVDTDGVALGLYGAGGVQQDMCNAWTASPQRHEVQVVQNDMHAWATRCRPSLVVDFQACGGTNIEGIHMVVPDKESDLDGHNMAVKWAHLVTDALGKTYAAEEPVREDDRAAPGCRRLAGFVQEAFSISTLVIKVPYACCKGTLMNQKQYREAGRLVGKAILSRL
ncbi:MAG: hypothetical protein ISS35_06710 [Kiritimatiellae bacterium]|nr:hypothetical protein [Kiritimatiellia bacterium]